MTLIFVPVIRDGVKRLLKSRILLTVVVRSLSFHAALQLSLCRIFDGQLLLFSALSGFVLDQPLGET
jgi:hypothetical protein